METYDISVEKISTTWIENLALDEINMDESGVIQFNQHLNPLSVVEESSIQLMNRLKDRFELYVQKFNEYRGNQTKNSSIKMYKISNTINDFMLYRNSLRLVFARRSHDTISIGFLSNSGGLYSARLNSEIPASNNAHEIKATVGAFNKISWKFAEDTIDEDALVKHYLTEFIQNSAK